MDLEQFKSNEDFEQNGVWVDMGDWSIKVARFGISVEHKKLVRKLLKPYRRQLQNDTLDPDILDKIELQAMAVLIKDWKGVKLSGKVVKCTPETIKSALAIYDFKKEVEFVVNERATFQQEALENDSKN